MTDPRLILGRIVGVNGTTPGPASGISYTIKCHDPNVEGPYSLSNQKPIRRWPDTLDTVAFAVGSMVQGIVDANVVQWHSMEMPDFAECPSNSGGSGMLELLRSGGIPQAFLPSLPGSGSVDAGGGSDNPSGPTPGNGSTD